MTTARLPEAEQDVLGVLYDAGETTAREIRERLESRRPLAHASVVTLLGRLEAKGLVRRRKGESGKAFLFSPTRARLRTFGPVLSRLVKRAFQGNTAALVASLFESRPPNAREIADLETLLDEWRARDGNAQLSMCESSGASSQESTNPESSETPGKERSSS